MPPEISTLRIMVTLEHMCRTLLLLLGCAWTHKLFPSYLVKRKLLTPSLFDGNSKGYQVLLNTKPQTMRNDIRAIHTLIDIHAIYSSIRNIILSDDDEHKSHHTGTKACLSEPHSIRDENTESRGTMQMTALRKQADAITGRKRELEKLAATYEAETKPMLDMAEQHQRAPIGNSSLSTVTVQASIMQQFMALQSQVSFLQITLDHLLQMSAPQKRPECAIRFMLRELSRFTCDSTNTPMQICATAICELCETPQTSDNAICESCGRVMTANGISQTALGSDGADVASYAHLRVDETRPSFMHLKTAMSVFYPESNTATPRCIPEIDNAVMEVMDVFRLLIDESHQGKNAVSTQCKSALDRLTNVSSAFRLRTDMIRRAETRLMKLVQMVLSTLRTLAIPLVALHPLYILLGTADQLTITACPEDETLLCMLVSTDEMHTQDAIFNLVCQRVAMAVVFVG